MNYSPCVSNFLEESVYENSHILDVCPIHVDPGVPSFGPVGNMAVHPVRLHYGWVAVMHGTYTGQIINWQAMPRDQMSGIDLTPENTGK